jgi:hypothetical protein
MQRENLLGGPPATFLLEDTDAAEAMRHGAAPAEVASRFPTYSDAWAALAIQAYARDDDITAYAYARTGYHRGLDQLRRAGWKGHGPIPWEHEPNALRGVPARQQHHGRGRAGRRALHREELTARPGGRRAGDPVTPPARAVSKAARPQSRRPARSARRDSRAS